MAMAGGALTSSAIYVDGVANKLGDDSIWIVFEGQSLLFAATSAGLVLFALTAGLAIARTRALPSYTMWLAYLAALGNLVAMISTVTAGASAVGLAGVISFALFVLVTGIVMAIGKATPAPAALPR